MSALELQVYDLFKKRFNDEEAKLVINFFDAKAEEKYEQKKDILATKQDIAETKLDLINKIEDVRRSIYLVGLIQFLAIVGSVLAIMSFMLRK